MNSPNKTEPPHNLSDSEGAQQLQDEWDEEQAKLTPEQRRAAVRALADLKPAEPDNRGS